MPHNVFMKYHLIIGDTTFSFFNAKMSLIGSHWSIVQYFDILFFQIIYVSHPYLILCRKDR